MPSPLDHANVMLTRLTQQRTPDKMGGFKTTWVEGTPFPALLSLDNSMAAIQAQQQGVDSVYKIKAPADVTVNGLDYLRSDTGQVFQVTTDPKKTPTRASFSVQELRARKAVLPDG